MAALSGAMHRVFCSLETAHVEKDRLDTLRIRIQEEKKKEREAGEALRKLDSRLQTLRDRRQSVNLTGENLQQMLKELCYLITIQTTKWAALNIKRKALEREFVLQSTRPHISELETCRKQLISEYDKTMKVYGRVRERLNNLKYDM